MKEICLEKQDFYIYNQEEEHQEYLEPEGASESHPLFHLPGLTQKMVRGDQQRHLWAFDRQHSALCMLV